MSSSEKALRLLWEKTYYTEDWTAGHSIIETCDGGIVISGTSGHPVMNPQLLLIKIDVNGEIIWSQQYESDCYYGYRSTVCKTSDSGFAALGQLFSYDSKYDIYLIKTNETGNTVWTKTFGGLRDDMGCSIYEKYEGGYIITGWSTLPSSYQHHTILINTDSNGDTLWSKIFNEGTGLSVQQTTDYGFIVTGKEQETYGGEPYLFLLKTDENGRKFWNWRFLFSCGNSVKETTDNGFIVTGWKENTSNNDVDIYLLKTDEKGIKVWERTYGSQNNDVGYDVIETTFGYMVTGFSTSYSGDHTDLILIKTDFKGNLLWSYKYGGEKDDIGYSVLQIANGQYMVTGSSLSFNDILSDIYVIKLEE